MIDWLQLTASLLAGVALGLAFFWSLWRTTHRLVRQDRPALRMLGGVIVRFGSTLAVFYLLARYGDFRHLLGAAAGFTLSRLLILRLLVRRRVGQGPET